MAKRKIICIDEEQCNGCGECIPNCPEGALQVIDGKARVVSDLFCDGLGACVGHCPAGAMTVEEREAEPYSEKKVMENIVKAGDNTIKAHLRHLKEHGEEEYLKQAVEILKKKKITVPDLDEEERLPCGCPGTKVMEFGQEEKCCAGEQPAEKAQSRLRQWPVQITLVPPSAPYLKNSDLLIAADCVPFAYADFHNDLLKGKILLVGCPKLDDIGHYSEKLALIVKQNNLKSVTYAHMEVPCCFSFIEIIKSAIKTSGKKIPFRDITIGIKGEKLKETTEY